MDTSMQTIPDPELDEDGGISVVVPSFPYPTDGELLRLFLPSNLEAQTMFDDKTAEWQERADLARLALRQDLRAISAVQDPFSRWFWTQVLKISPAAKELREALGQIDRLCRVKRLANRIFNGGDRETDRREPSQAVSEARQIPILDVMSRTIKVKKAGKAYMARCPFHDDRNPSLAIYPDTNRFKCYGCQKGGDAIEFVRLHFGYGFREAIDYVTRGGNEDERQSNRRRIR